MPADGGARGLALWRQVWAAEGARAVAARAWDRLEETRRQRSFRAVGEPPPGFVAPVLIVAAAAPAPRLGGVQAQLKWRLDAEAALRPIALLYPDAGSRRSVPSGRAAELPEGREYRSPEASGQPATSPDGGGFRLELQRGEERWALAWQRPAAAPPPSAPATALIDVGFEAAVAWAAASCGAAAMHVEGLAGMPLGSLLRLTRDGLRLILAVHDFAAFCPRPHLLEMPAPPAAPRFCHYSRDPARCARCLAQTWPGLPPGYQEERRELALELMAAAAAVVYPSAFMAGAHAQLFAAAAAGAGGDAGGPGPDLPRPVRRPGHSLAVAGAEPTIIAPAPPPSVAINDARDSSSRSAAPRRSPLRPGATRRPPRHIAWVGAVHVHKGALVFEAAVRALAAAGRHPQLSAYGGGDRAIPTRWRRLPGLRVRGYYRAGSLPALLRRDRVDLALVLSVVPESYGLTLDECAAANVPVIAFAIGAIGDRMTPASGLLLDAALADDPAIAGRHLANLLGDLLDGTVSPTQAVAAAPTDDTLPHAAATAAAWLALYRRLGLYPPPS